jgi:small subunit ribosomal protein S5
VRDVLTKSIGTQNPINLVKATMDGLVRLRRPEEVAELRGLTVTQVLGMDGGNGAAAPASSISDEGQAAEDAGPVSDTSSSPTGEDPASSPPASDAAPVDEKPADEAAEEKAAEGAEAEKQESGS